MRGRMTSADLYCMKGSEQLGIYICKAELLSIRTCVETAGWRSCDWRGV